MKFTFSFVLLLTVAQHAQGLVVVRNGQTHNATELACEASDLKNRIAFQNKLHGACKDMCKEVGAYPNCGSCPAFVAPDSTPGVMTWKELLEHMDNLEDWGRGEIKAWTKQATALMQSSSCEQNDLSVRHTVQSFLGGVCEKMCKDVGAYPNCAQCQDFVAPDSTPGVMTWEELLGHMGNLVEWGRESLKGWGKQASAALVQTTACEASDLKNRIAFQNKLHGDCKVMCKEVGAYPNCGLCPAFVAPDSTPGVMTWEELLEHMDNLGSWGRGEIKAWTKQATALVQSSSCEANDLKVRERIQTFFAKKCEEKCKVIEAYPTCRQCKNIKPPDSTPGVMTWPEVLTHMDELVG